MRNLRDFKRLILRYESITEKEILEANAGIGDTFGESKANALTGYGIPETCSLCKKGMAPSGGLPRCRNCTYLHKTKSTCSTGVNKPTYEGIEGANCVTSLKAAFRRRAKYMRGLLR